MAWKWRELARRSAKWLTLGSLLVAAVIALYFGMLEPRTRYHSIAEQRASGLGAIREDYGAPLATPFRLKRISAPVTAANLAGLEQPSQVAYNAAPAPSDVILPAASWCAPHLWIWSCSIRRRCRQNPRTGEAARRLPGNVASQRRPGFSQRLANHPGSGGAFRRGSRGHSQLGLRVEDEKLMPRM